MNNIIKYINTILFFFIDFKYSFSLFSLHKFIANKNKNDMYLLLISFNYMVMGLYYTLISLFMLFVYEFIKSDYHKHLLLYINNDENLMKYKNLLMNPINKYFNIISGSSVGKYFTLFVTYVDNFLGKVSNKIYDIFDKYVISKFNKHINNYNNRIMGPLIDSDDGVNKCLNINNTSNINNVPKLNINDLFKDDLVKGDFTPPPNLDIEKVDIEKVGAMINDMEKMINMMAFMTKEMNGEDIEKFKKME